MSDKADVCNEAQKSVMDEPPHYRLVKKKKSSLIRVTVYADKKKKIGTTNVWTCYVLLSSIPLGWF